MSWLRWCLGGVKTLRRPKLCWAAIALSAWACDWPPAKPIGGPPQWFMAISIMLTAVRWTLLRLASPTDSRSIMEQLAPWRPGSPLPFGPPDVRPVDVAVLLLLEWLLRLTPLVAPGVPTLVAAGLFSLSKLFTLNSANIGAVGRLILALPAGLLIVGGASPTSVAAANGAMVPLALFLGWASLREKIDELQSPTRPDEAPHVEWTALDWPFTMLAPPTAGDAFAQEPAAERLWLSAAVAGAWAAALTSRVTLGVAVAQWFWFPPLACTLVAGFAANGRLERYTVLNWYIRAYSPSSRIGLLRRGRPILPGHDIVYVAPLLSLLTGVISAIITWHAGRFAIVVVFVGCAVCVAVARGLPPRRVDWITTGSIRIGAPRGRPKRWLDSDSDDDD